jgi:hypothetical protein
MRYSTIITITIIIITACPFKISSLQAESSKRGVKTSDVAIHDLRKVIHTLVVINPDRRG